MTAEPEGSWKPVHVVAIRLNSADNDPYSVEADTGGNAGRPSSVDVGSAGSSGQRPSIKNNTKATAFPFCCSVASGRCRGFCVSKGDQSSADTTQMILKDGERFKA